MENVLVRTGGSGEIGKSEKNLGNRRKRGRCGIAGSSLGSYYSMSVILIADCLKGNSGSLLGKAVNDEFTGSSRNESAVEIAVSRSSLVGLGYGVSGLGDVIDCQLAQI